MSIGKGAAGGEVQTQRPPRAEHNSPPLTTGVYPRVPTRVLAKSPIREHGPRWRPDATDSLDPKISESHFGARNPYVGI